MKYCLHCGCIYAESYTDYENEECDTCGFQLIEDTTMTEERFIKLSESEKDEYELRIYNICKQSEFFDEDEYNKNHKNLASNWYISFRFDKYEQLTGKKAWTKENELYHDMESKKRVSEAMAKYAGTTTNSSNVPKCPTCQSTNLRKISATSKVTNTVLFGIFGTKRHKTFHCNNCGYEW